MRTAQRSLDVGLGWLLFPFIHPKLRLVTVAVVALGVGWAFGIAGWAAESVGRPLHKRAAFSWEERFEGGFRDWTNPQALAPAGADTVRVQGMALHVRTRGMTNYEMNFLARVDKKSLGWVVKAADPGNYYVFKLNPRNSVTAGKRDYDLVRYAVVGGHVPRPQAREIAPVVVRVEDGKFFEVTVRATEDEVFTLVNGYGIDTWKHPKLKAGALGFLAEPGESFLVKSLVISGNEDFLGLFLWGAEETFRSVQRALKT